MSDAAVATIVSGAITIVGLVVGFLTMWVKLTHASAKAEQAVDQAKVVENKIDHNTSMTAQAAVAAEKASEHTADCDEERVRILKGLAGHDGRISALETQMPALRLALEGVTKNLDTTRHEMRGHLQAVVSKLDLLSLTIPRGTLPEPKARGGDEA